MSVLTRTHTRTHLTITPANPFLACCTCKKRVTAFHDPGCGCGEDRPMNFPCCDYGEYVDLCPSWGPVDGCQCVRHFGKILHLAVIA